MDTRAPLHLWNCYSHPHPPSLSVSLSFHCPPSSLALWMCSLSLSQTLCLQSQGCFEVTISVIYSFFLYINTASCDLRPVVGGWRERGRTHMHLHTVLDSLSYYLVWVTSVSCCRMCHHQCDNFSFARGWNICFFLCYVCLWRGFIAVSTVSSSFFCFDQDCNR